MSSFLHKGNALEVTVAPQSLKSMAFNLLDVRGYRVSLIRASKLNVGTVLFGFGPVLDQTEVGGFLTAGESVAFSHPRPDLFDIWVSGVNNDVIYVTFMKEYF